MDTHRWTQGECGTFAVALHRYLNYPIFGLIERAERDGDEAIVHLFCVSNGLMIDANGVQPYPATEVEGTMYPGEKSSVLIRPYTPEQVAEAREAVEDVEDLGDAWQAITDHLPIFLVPHTQLPPAAPAKTVSVRRR